MISCRDVNNLQMDGMELVAGAAGLDRIVSWTYLVQTKPYNCLLYTSDAADE